MNVEDAIRKRRSIRHYGGEMPKDEDIKKILLAGVWAPSGLNNQPWKFMAITNKTTKDGLAAFTKKEYGSFIIEAPVAICVFLDNSISYNRDKDLMATGACIQNMLLQAYELGMGTCWLGEIINRKDQVQQYLDTNPDFELMAVITLGYPEGKVPEGSRRNLESFLL